MSDFYEKLTAEKEIKKDRLELLDQERRGNRVSNLSTNIDIILGVLFFLSVFVAFFWFCYENVIKVYGW